MNHFIQKNRWNLLIWGITLFFSLLYLSLIFSKNIWTDEAYTLQLIEGSFLDIIKGTANDVHPPLYYFFAKVIDFIFPNELLPQKLLTILPMSLTLVLGATKIRKLFGEIPAFFFLLFLTCIPCTMEFSVQVRMYSLALLFVTLCGVSAYELYVEPKRIHWILFTFSALGAGYTHYFSLVSVAVIVGLLFLVFVAKRKPLKPMLCSMACMILLYLPWFLILIQQLNRVTTSYWIPEITSHTIWSYFTWIFDLKLLPGTVYVFCLLFVYLIGTCIYSLIKKKELTTSYALFCLLIPILTALIGVVVSLLTRPIYRDQYIMPSLGLLALFVGICVKRFHKVVLLLLASFLLLVGAIQYKESYRQEYKSTYLTETLDFFDKNLTNDDYILYNYRTFDFIYRQQFEHTIDRSRLYYLEEFDFGRDFENVWFLKTKWEPELTQELLEQSGLSMELVGLYGIEHNEFELYLIYKK